MTGNLSHLLIAMLVFIGGHFVMSSLPVRTPVIQIIGEQKFKGVYALISLGAMVWVVTAYMAAPVVEYWQPHTAFKHFSLSFMIIALISIIAALTPIKSADGADTAGPRGIFRITRHPMMWGIALWSFLHVLANDDLAALIFFGGFTILALAGTAHGDRRKALTEGENWQILAAQSSHIPFAAILTKRTQFSAKEIGWLPVILGFGLYLVLLILHETMFGSAPISWVAGLFD